MPFCIQKCTAENASSYLLVCTASRALVGDHGSVQLRGTLRPPCWSQSLPLFKGRSHNPVLLVLFVRWQHLLIRNVTIGRESWSVLMALNKFSSVIKTLRAVISVEEYVDICRCFITFSIQHVHPFKKVSRGRNIVFSCVPRSTEDGSTRAVAA